MVKRSRLLAAAGLALSWAWPVWSGDTPYPTKPVDLTNATAYSNVCLHPDTLDALGLRIFVRRPGEPPRVLGQLAEGELGEPLVATTRVVRGRHTFRLPGDVPAATFDGVIHRDYVLARSEAPHDHWERLNRRDDRHGFPMCR